MLQFLTTKQNRLDAVALVLEATQASSTGNFETLGSKFRHETEGLLPPFATQIKSHHSNVPSYTHVHKNRLDSVAEVNVAKTATFTGKIET